MKNSKIKNLILLTLLFSLAILAILFSSAPASAAITRNQNYNLATDPLTDWTENGTGRTGVRLQSTGNVLFYTRTDATVDDGAGFQIEAVASADPLYVGERGARMWVQFHDAPLSPLNRYKVEVRMNAVGGVRRLDLVDGHNGSVKASLVHDWANTVPRLRIRLKRQEIGGQDYIFMQAEPSTGWDNPAQSNNLSDANSVSALLSSFSASPGTSEIGFGNVLIAVSYYSEWEKVHVTTADDLVTVMPYWPPVPPAPALLREDIGQGCLQRVNVSADMSSMGLLINDSATPALDANGTTYSGEIRTNPGNELWYFDNISCTQAVYGSVIVSDVSGRSRTSSDTTLTQGIAENLYYNLATNPLTDWTASGAGLRTGIKLQSNNNTLTYRRTDLAMAGNAFLLEAVVSAEPLAVDGDRGARFWVWFDSGQLGKVIKAEVRLTRVGGAPCVELFDAAAGVSMATLNVNWTNSADRMRLRLKRQRVGGQDYLFLQEEPASGWDNPIQPNNLADPPRSQGVLLSSFTSVLGSAQVGFGNSQTGIYYSEWENVHVTTTNDLTTVLPYWPPVPPAPALLHEDSATGCLGRVDLSTELSSRYMSNDSATPALDANDTTYSGETRTNPGSEIWYFDGIACNQPVSGSVTVTDVSGRSRTSSDTTIPALVHPLTLSILGTGTGTVTSNLAGINCGSDCSELYDDGTYITLTATPGSCSIFAGWSGGGCSGTGTCTATMDADKTVTATFNPTKPTVDFSALPLSGLSPLTVNFTDASTCGASSWSWTFGDGGTSTSQNPSHTYNPSWGSSFSVSYPVSLTATNANGSNELTKTSYITVQCPNSPVKNVRTGASYNTLQAAHDAAIAGDTIRSHALTSTENLTVSKAVTFDGGYNCDFTSRIGKTTLTGNLTVGAGSFTVNIDNFDVQ